MPALASLALAACAAPGPAPIPPLAALDARIVFTLREATPPRVEVAIETRGAASGETTFSLEESWGGVDHFERGVRGARAETPEGSQLSALPAGERSWRVAHAPGEEIRFCYELVSLTPTIEDTSECYYRPIVLPGLFHLIGNAGIARPDSLPSERDLRIEIRFVGFRERGWQTISSHGDDETTRLVRPWTAVVHALFLAGDLRIHRVKTPGSTLCIAIDGNDWHFTDAAFVDLARRVVEAERGFFHDDSDPYYLISAIPVGKAAATGHSLGGTGLTASFALFMRPDTRLEDAPHRPSRVKHLLSHELFHNWNGRIIQREEPEELVYWFSEGFTDYYARRLMLRAGLITPEQFVDDLNARILECWGNPKLREPNATILSDFWKDPKIQRLPYERGDMVAFMVDFEMRKRLGARQSLDDLMIELYEGARARNEAVSTDRLLERIAVRTSAEFAARIRGIVVDGNPISLDPNILAPMASMETVASMETADPSSRSSRGSDKAPHADAPLEAIPQFHCRPGARAEDWLYAAPR